MPTSLTICPSCGASLHVPEKMVGSVVHCAECGKPFHVEEGSSIQVARAVPPPFGPRPRPRRQVPAWVWIVAGCAALLLLWLAATSIRMSRSVEQQRMAVIAEQQRLAVLTESPMAAKSTRPPQGDPFWKSALSGLPAEATAFGPLRPPAARLPHPRRRPDTDHSPLALPGRDCRAAHPENLGRIRIDAVGVAYYEGAKGEDARGVAHLEGLALDGRKRIIDFLRRTAEGPVESNDQKGTANPLVRVSGPELPFALGLFEDHNAFLARSLKPSGSRHPSISKRWSNSTCSISPTRIGTRGTS